MIAQSPLTRELHGRRHVLVDSGANEGMWSILAGAHGGCSVLAIEPQPSCVRLVNSSLLKNAAHLDGRVSLLPRLLSPTPQVLEMSVLSECDGGGTFTREGMINSVGKFIPMSPGVERKLQKVPVPSTRLDEVSVLQGKHKIIELWHLDVEGAELLALRSAERLFAERRIRRVMVEVTTSKWRSFGIEEQAGLAELQHIFEGWTCTVGCNKAPYSWKSGNLGVCDNHAGSRSPQAYQGTLVALDVYCLAPGLTE